MSLIVGSRPMLLYRPLRMLVFAEANLANSNAVCLFLEPSNTTSTVGLAMVQLSPVTPFGIGITS